MRPSRTIDPARERRRSRRHDLCIPCTATNAEVAYGLFWTQNVSAGGALVHGSALDVTNGSLRLDLHFPWAVGVGVGALVLWPRFVSAGDRRRMPWLDAWLKAIAIVLWFVVFTVYVPSEVMQSDTVADLDKNAQDVIGTGLWLGGMAVGIWGLWYASRHRRI